MQGLEKYEALVACERSGRVRDALTKVGVKTISCDLHPTRSPGPHYEGDVRDILELKHWKLLIAHPVCRYLANSGAKHLYNRIDGVWAKENGRNEERWELMKEGVEFFLLFERADHIPMRAVENPIMHGYASELIGRKADQFVEPWWFGDPFKKATGFHLTGLPKLVREREKSSYAPGEIKQEAWLMRQHPDREELRSQTYPNVARAIAEQWGPLVRGGLK